ELALVKLKEEELKTIESEKLRAVGELAAGMFHELHNYMNMIMNGATPLKEGLADLSATLGASAGGQDLAELFELASLVATAATQARDVTGELKSFAYHEREMKPIDVHNVIQSTVRMFGRRTEAMKLDLRLFGEPLVVQGVTNRLTHVFMNLLKNAFEAV